MQPILVFLPAPSDSYLSKAKMASWLGMEPDEVDQLVEDGVIVKPKVRKRRELPTWTQLEAAIAKWELDNDDRYNRPDPENKGPKR